MNPGMSHKDRIAKAMLAEAESRGDLVDSNGNKKTILAASSGNTGCSLALIGTTMGYDVVIITNKKCSAEKCAHIRTNGATLWLAEDLPGMFPEDLTGVTDYMAQETVLCATYPDKYFSVNQYDNLDNMQAHYDTTGKEIWEQTEGKVRTLEGARSEATSKMLLVMLMEDMCEGEERSDELKVFYRQ